MNRTQLTSTSCFAAVVAALAAASVVNAQQEYPPNGLRFFGDANRSNGRTLLQVGTSRGSLRTLSINAGEDMRVLEAPAKGTTVGRIALGPQGTFTLRTGGHSSHGVTLVRHGALRVTYRAGTSKGALRISGLKTTHVEITLKTRRGLIVPLRCPGSETLTAVATRAGAGSPVHTTSSVSC
jgi:hypothetical protein